MLQSPQQIYLINPVPAKPILGVRSTKHGNSEQVPSLVSCSPFKTNKQTKNFKHFEIFIKNILLWLKGTEILEDGPVNPWTVNTPANHQNPIP